MFKKPIDAELRKKGFNAFVQCPLQTLEEALELIKDESQFEGLNEFYLSTAELVGGRFKGQKGYVVYVRIDNDRKNNF